MHLARPRRLRLVADRGPRRAAWRAAGRGPRRHGRLPGGCAGALPTARPLVTEVAAGAAGPPGVGEPDRAARRPRRARAGPRVVGRVARRGRVSAAWHGLRVG